MTRKKRQNGGTAKMLKELVKNNNSLRVEENNSVQKTTPVRKALNKFYQENNYDFLEMLSQEKLLKKHKLKQMQIADNDDNDFLENFQDLQGEEKE